MNAEAEFGANDSIEPDDPRSFKEYLLKAADKEVKFQAKTTLVSAATAAIMAACVVYPWLDNWTIWAIALCTLVFGVLLLMLVGATYGGFKNYMTASLFRDAFKLLPTNIDRDDIGDEKLRLIEALYVNYGNKTLLHHKAAAALRQLLTTKQDETD